ncbi:MAG: flavin reductase family protein [Chloroflexi bacterium]|nr:flavin reductase family protein [Chloroflexota bacterium]
MSDASMPPDLASPRAKSPDELVQQAMHELPYGIYIVGSVRDGEPNGMIADWVMQVSFRPRLLAVAFERSSYSLASIRANRAFTVNLLAEDGMTLAARFLQPREGAKIRGRSERAQAVVHRKLDGVEYSVDARGCPLLGEALAVFECEAEQFVDAGDHELVLGRVLDARLLRSADPLTSVYTGWSYSG